MATQVVCAIFDVKVGAYSSLMTFPTVGVAQRFFADECNTPESTVRRHPEDYDLRLLAKFDTDTGIVQPVKMEVISKAVDHVQS